MFNLISILSCLNCRCNFFFSQLIIVYLYHIGTFNSKIMLVISSREFRDNQKKYFDLIDSNEQVIVQRGKTKAYILTPISETDSLSRDKELIQMVAEAEIEYLDGKSIRIKNSNNIWESI